MKQDYSRRKKGGNNSFPSDDWILGIFDGWFDPCPLNPNWNPKHDIDGLSIPWQDKTYVNPPYSDPLPWVKKAIRENQKGHRIAMLLKHDSSAKWYQLLHQAGAHFLMPNNRLHYGCNDRAAFPSLLAILHKPEDPVLYTLTEMPLL